MEIMDKVKNLAINLLFIPIIGLGQPMVPKLAVLPPSYKITNYWAVNATSSNGITSSNSLEVITISTNKVNTYRATWDIVTNSVATDSITVTNYTLLQGPSTKNYTNTINTGTNTSIVTTIPKPPNLIVTISATNAPSISLTNPQGNLYVRSRYWRVTSTKWPTELQCSSLPSGPWNTLVGPITNSLRPTVRLIITKRYQ